MNAEQKKIWPRPTCTPVEQSGQPSCAPRLTLFVYGTLKSGQANHGRFCAHAAQIQPAATLGRLYALPAGYPALEIPEQHVLARGSANPLRDAAVQDRITSEFTNIPEQSRPGGDWDLVHGELITFIDPLRSLPPIDRLEGFHPRGPSLYQRVLLLVHANGASRLAWTYIMTECADGRRLREGIWF